MMYRKTDRFERRDGDFSAAAFAPVRDISSIRTASNAIISIIIRQTAR